MCAHVHAHLCVYVCRPDEGARFPVAEVIGIVSSVTDTGNLWRKQKMRLTADLLLLLNP